MRPVHSLIALLALLVCPPANGESHRATRFASPLATPEDLRALFRDPRLQPDFPAVLKQWGWQGKIHDLFAASATAEIADVTIPVGEVMPFMSSRKSGRAVCLRNVTWAGNEPAPAYAFDFASNGRRYRCVVPKACSNFFLKDLGPVPRFGLMVDCRAPDKVLMGRNVETCLTVRNTGNTREPQLAGVSALLLETTDDPDPVSVGDTTTYFVRVTTQGTADDTNVRVVVEFPAEVDPVRASNEGEITGRTVTFPPFPRLGPKTALKYTITEKGAKVGDARVKFIRTSDDIPAPTSAEESTRIY